MRLRSFLIVLATTAVTSTASAGQAPPGEIIERTLAIVGGQVITLSDANAAIALGLVDVAGEASPVAAATTRLVDRMLVLREVQRYAPPDPGDPAIDARLEEIRAKAGAGLARTLELTGFTESRLRVWVRDDLRSQAYLSQRFAAVGAPSQPEIAATFNRERADFERAGTTFEQAMPAIRDRLTAARRRELIMDWIADLRHRTDVIVLNLLDKEHP